MSLPKPKAVTGSMNVRGRIAAPGGMTSAGLVLLYAPHYELLPPTFLFDKPELTLGRDDDRDLVIADAAASGRHAVVRHEDGAWLLRDDGSRNGTLLFGEPIQGEVALEPLAEVRIGDALFKFVGAGAEGYASHRIDGVVLGGDTSFRQPEAIVGGAQLGRLLRRTRRVAESGATVIFTGESGTGKERFAAWTHEVSGRKGPLVPINCGALSDGLLQAELFGVVRGAYTGAERDRPGLFRAADGGTLFLDELGELPLAAQAKLLRVVQEKVVRPVGGTASYPVDVRLVCATHRDLPAMVAEGKFRADLLARLADFTLHLPPLRERKEDLYRLARTTLDKRGHQRVLLTTAFMTGLLHYDYPNNVRDLLSFLRRAVIECEGDALTEAHLPDAIQEAMQHYAPDAGRRGAPSEAEGDADDAETERDVAIRPSLEELVDALAEHRGNVAAVARIFKRGVTTVRRWIAQDQLDLSLFR